MTLQKQQSTQSRSEGSFSGYFLGGVGRSDKYVWQHNTSRISALDAFDIVQYLYKLSGIN